MRCPSCNGTIKYFSKLNFKYAKVKQCPHCDVKIKHSMNLKYFAFGFAPVVVIQLYLFGPFLHYLGVPYPYTVAQLITLYVFYSSLQEFKLVESPS